MPSHTRQFRFCICHSQLYNSSIRPVGSSVPVLTFVSQNYLCRVYRCKIHNKEKLPDLTTKLYVLPRLDSASSNVFYFRDAVRIGYVIITIFFVRTITNFMPGLSLNLMSDIEIVKKTLHFNLKPLELVAYKTYRINKVRL